MGFLGGRAKAIIRPPSGEHAVGTTRYEVTAEGAGGSPPRRVPVQAWYPARPSDGVREYYLDDELRAALSDLTGVPKFLLRQNPSFSVVNAPAAAGRFPVLVFNHGFGSFQKQSTSLLEELASHGYVVLSVGHAGESLVVQRSDGTVVRHRRDHPAWLAIQAGLKELERNVREVEPLLARARSAAHAPELLVAMQAVAAHPTYAVLLPVLEGWTRDTLAVLDGLGRLDDGQLAAPLRGIVEPKRVGAFGHSLGGILAGQLAMTDDRVRAGMSYDGAQLPPPGAPYALRAPFCFVYADATKVGGAFAVTEGIDDALVNDGPPGSCSVTIRGAAHLNFTDMNNVAMMARALGRIDRAEMAKVLRAMTVGFFDHHLAGKPLAGLAPSQTLQVRWAQLR